MSFKYFCYSPIKKGGLKRVWILTNNNGWQNYDGYYKNKNKFYFSRTRAFNI